MKTYVIMSAMKEEIKPVVDYYQAELVDTINSQELLKFKKDGDTYFLINSGIGKVNAAITTTLVIERLKPEFILSVGTSGGIDTSLSICDIVVASEMVFHDVDVTGFGYELGQLPGEEPRLKIKGAKSFGEFLQQKDIETAYGLIATGDQFINDKQVSLSLAEKFTGLYAVEMESASILMTCQHLDVDCFVVRGISDLAHADSTMEFDNYISVVSDKFKHIVDCLGEFFGK